MNKTLRPPRPRDLLAALILTGGLVVIWLDFQTGLWQEIVILSGIVAGLLTFLMTALYFESWIARASHKRWQPVTRLALIDLLHALADEEQSEISRGHIVPRSLDPGDHQALLHQLVEERRKVTESLARWSSFLAASADVQQLMIHIASLAEQLDAVRDSVIDYETSDSAEDRRAVERLTSEFNATAAQAVDEIQGLLARQS